MNKNYYVSFNKNHLKAICIASFNAESSLLHLVFKQKFFTLLSFYFSLTFFNKSKFIKSKGKNDKNVKLTIATECIVKKTNYNLKIAYRGKSAGNYQHIMSNKNNSRREWFRRKSFDARLAAGRNIALASSLFPKTRDPLLRRGPDRRQTVRSVSWSFRFCKQIPHYKKKSARTDRQRLITNSFSCVKIIVTVYLKFIGLMSIKKKEKKRERERNRESLVVLISFQVFG